MYKNLLAILAVLLVTGCGDDGDDPKSGGSGPAEVTVEEVEIPAVEVDPIRLRFVLTDLDGNAVNASGTARIVSDSEGLINGTTYPVNAGELRIEGQTGLPDEDNNGSPDTFASVGVNFSNLSGYLDSTATFTVSRFGENVFEVPLMPLVKNETLTVEQRTATMKEEPPADPPARAGGESRDGPAVTAVGFEARGEIPDAPRATAYVPQDLIAYDENGEELEAGELTVVVAAIASEKAAAAGAIPASGVTDINNPDLIENDPVLGADISDASRVRLTTLASARVSAVTESGAAVSRMNPATTITVVIHLPLGAVNPKTSEVIEEGDLVPVFSQSDHGGRLSYEGLHTVEQGDDGLFVMFETSHLSYFNVSFAEMVDGCSGRIYVHDVNGENFPHTGIFKLESDRLINEDAYRGGEDGQIVFKDLPNAPTSIVFVSDDGEPVSWVPETTTIGLTSDGAVTPAMATDVDLCASQGTTITLKDNTPSGPVLVVDYKKGWRSGSTIYAGGLREGNKPEDAATLTIPMVLLNPEDEPVKVTYSIEGEASPGHDIIDPGSGTLILSAAEPAGEIVIRTLPDTNIEKRYKNFHLTIQNEDGIPFSNGGSQMHVRGTLYDDDKPEIVDISVDDVTEGEDMVVTVTLDKPVTESGRYVTLQLVPLNEAGTRAAWPGKDIGRIRDEGEGYNFSLYSGRAQLRPQTYRVTFPEGQHVADITIPTIDNATVDGSRSAILRPSDAYEIYMPEADLDRRVTIFDNDPDPGTEPKTFTLSAVDSRGHAFIGTDLREGDDLLWLITLDAPAKKDMNLDVNLDQPGNSHTWWAAVEGGTLKRLGSANTFTIRQGETRLALYMSAGYDGRVLGDYGSGVVTVSSADLGVDEQTSDILVRDIDETEIDIHSWIYPYQAEFIEGKDTSFSVELIYSSNDPATSIGFAPLSVRLDATHPAKEGIDFNLLEREIGRFEGESGYRTLDVEILDDDIGEHSETLRFDAVVANLGALSDNARWIPSINQAFTSTAVIIDDDMLVIALKDTRFAFESNGAFDGEVSTEVALTIAMEEDLSFDVELVDTDGLALNRDTATITIKAGEKSGTATFKLLATNPEDLELSQSETEDTRRVTASVRMTEESRQWIKEKGLEMLISKADAKIILDFNYTGQAPATGATGGTGI